MRLLAPLVLLLALCSPIAFAASDSENAIKTVLHTQLEAWNRGDIPGFVTTYATDCIFVGKQIARGKEQLMARYEKTYPNREAMGHLTFNALDVHLLTTEVAIVTGEWHIQRSGKAEGVGGLFSLVFRRQSKEWKIALDHTS